MEIKEKIRILGEAGKWDICASSNSKRKVKGKDRIGNTSIGGICHSFTENGRCISLFKTLMTNACNHDCKYCVNSTKCHKRLAKYSPEELSKVFMKLYLGNYVEGLFLSSGVLGNSDSSTERMLDAVNILRNKYKFRGYIHFKALPGVGRDYIKRASEIADRISINLEAPNSSRMKEITDIKDYKIDILRRQNWIKKTKVSAGQTTQLVVGGSDETDWEILKMSDWEYNNMKMKRTYYSAFTPVKHTALSAKIKTPIQREHRLYNVDFMLRKYGIGLKEFKQVMDNGNLPKGDPKIHLARNYFARSVDLNECSYEELIRVPGIGPTSATRIMSLRKTHTIKKREELHNIGVVLKRAEPFIKINGYAQKTIFAYGG